MTKVNVTNHNLKVLQFLLNEGILSESYLHVTTDICLHQAKANLEKEMHTHYDPASFNEIIRAEVV